MLAIERREVAGAPEVVELALGLLVRVGAHEKLAAYDLGGKRSVGLRQHHEIDPYDGEQSRVSRVGCTPISTSEWG